jgi:hypothetical protein
MIRMLFCLSFSLIVLCGAAKKSSHVPRRELASAVDRGGPLPDAATMVNLAKTDPIAFLEWTLIRYDREVKGYSCLLIKQERLRGALQDREKIEVLFKDKPLSVLMTWKEGGGLTGPSRVVYVEGENKGMLTAKVGFLVVDEDPLGERALRSGRYPLTEFGMKIGARRALTSWKDAQKGPKTHGPLRVEYLGEKEVKELGRTCYALRRVGYEHKWADGCVEVETTLYFDRETWLQVGSGVGYEHKWADGCVEVETTLYFDRETWLQVGSVLKGKDGEVIGEYLFRDVHLNPTFKDDPFSRKAVTGG